MQNKTLTKQFIIVSIFIAAIALVSLVIYFIVIPPATCSDKKQNQGEKGIDCGGPCTPCKVIQAADLKVQETSFVTGGNGTYDVVAKIYNPNDSLGAKSFNYTFTLKDSAGTVIATKSGTDFILPVDTKYVAQLGLTTQNGAVAASAEISISAPAWAPLGNVEKPQLNVYNKKFDKVATGEGSEADGLLSNDSGYDLNKITLVIVLRDVNGKVVGINTTEKDTVRAAEQRDFRLSWPYALPGSVQSMEVDAQSNVLDPMDFSVTQQQ